MNMTIKSSHSNHLSFRVIFLLPQVNIQLPLRLVKRLYQWLALLPLISILCAEQVQAQQVQPIIPASDGTGTVIKHNGNQINISGGQLSSDKANLFHSFTEFNLNTQQIANFLSNPSIQNILGRVVGGNPSVINGVIQVTGSNANLFLMNPSGIVFGSTASLNVPGAFTATTANGIGFGDNWFSASGSNNYAALVGNPGAFSFSMTQPGAIFNTGNLTVGNGQNLTLLAGTVANTGSVSAPQGQIIVSAVPGENFIRLSQPRSPLSLEIQPLPKSGSQPQAWSLPILSLPQLLTSGGGGNATKLTVNSDNKVQLSGSGILVADGDVVTGNVTAKTATLSANRNLTVVESQLGTTGDLNLLAKDTVQIRDSMANPLVAKAGGQLYLQGDQKVDIFALSNPNSGLFSGGNMTLRSANTVGGDARFTVGGNFRIEKLDGRLGGLSSPHDPVFQVAGDYSTASYDGDSLQILAGGSVNIPGNVTIRYQRSGGINNGTVTLSDGSSVQINGNNPTLDVRAGTTRFFGTPTPGTPTSANINIGSITNTNPGGVLLLTNQYFPNLSLQNGSISVGQIDLSNVNVAIDARNNITTTRNINTGGGSIKMISGGDINTVNLNSSATSSAYGASISGAIALNAQGNITFGTINTQATTQGGNVNVIANGLVKGAGVLTSDTTVPPNTTILTTGTNPGTVTIQHDGGPDNVPFTVGNATINGTLGAIDAGSNSRISSGSFPVLPNGGNAIGTPNGITIISVNSPPTLTVNSKLNTTQQDTPINFTFADLNPVVNDINHDHTSLRIDSITGKLTKNGVEVVPGTQTAILSPGNNLEYTPPQGVYGNNINAFTISASDGVSSSASQPIGINVTPTLPPPEKTKIPQQNIPPVVGLPTPIVNASIPTSLDPAAEAIDNKFAGKFESYLELTPSDQKRERRVTLYEMRDILRQIEKATGVKPAIIYVTFVPSRPSENILQKELKNNQDSDELNLVVITAKGEPITKTIFKAKRQEVLKVAKEFRYAVNEERNTDNNDYLVPAQKLYQWMIQPLKDELNKQKINNLLLITDEGLRSIPLAALHDGKQFLVENYSVGFSPSISLTDTRYVDIRNSQVLAMGVSDFEHLTSSQKIDDLHNLPAVPVELSTITQDLWKGKSFLNQSLTLNNLKSLHRNQPFGILHLATHGEFKAGKLDKSYIQLWDNPLRLTQLRELELNNPPVELLVLSACRTALGEGYEDAELGFGGLAAKAGVKTVVASLWYVSDAGTLALMTEFYRHLKTAPIKSEALRQAQIAMLKGQVRIENGKLYTPTRGIALPPESPDSKQQKNLTHPYYWAAFTMIGNPW